MNIRAHVLIEERVQGVFFRSETLSVARQHNLTGWVKNLPDGRVEAIFEGVEEDVERAVQWCHRGPLHAMVNINEDPIRALFIFNGCNISHPAGLTRHFEMGCWGVLKKSLLKEKI